MTRKMKVDRRSFLQASGSVALGAALGAWSFKARAELRPARIYLTHFADPMLGESAEQDFASRGHPDYLFVQGRALVADIVAQAMDREPGPELVLTSGRSSKAEREDTQQPRCLKSPGDRLKLSPSSGAGCLGANFSKLELGGFIVLGLKTSQVSDPQAPSQIPERANQLRWLEEELNQCPSSPAVLALGPPLLATDLGAGLEKRDEEALLAIIKAHPQIILVLGGKVLGNRAGYLPGTGALQLVTCSPIVYPCGARLVEAVVAENGQVTVRSEFIQTRRLDLVEQSFYRADLSGAILRLGRREDRGFVALSGAREIQRTNYPRAAIPGPWPISKESLTLAVVSDTHVCLNKFMNKDQAKDYQLIGHFMEPESHEIFSDILEQVVDGRHRIEFYDQVFSKSPKDDRFYLDLPVDALLICGDLNENGRREEAETVKARLAALPASLRERTLLALGNHDLFSKDFAPDGKVSNRKLICDFYQGWGLGRGLSHYAVELNDWVSLIVLDTVIPSISAMGMIQDQIDWLIDQVESRQDKVVLIASHHEQYPLSLVPPAMTAMLVSRSHFTPPKSALRTQLHQLYDRSKNLKMLITGHYHGTVVDQFKKEKAAGSRPDDPFTTHVQVPCTAEYPCGYRLFKISREGEAGRIEYISAYSRLFALRDRSCQANIYKVFGGKARPPLGYQGTKERMAQRSNIFGELAKLNPYDLVKLNVRGFKDGTANFGRGNTGKPNINGQLEFTI